MDQGTSNRRRRYSKELPPDLSNTVRVTLRESVATFIKHFDTGKGRMESIACRLCETADDVQNMHNKTDKVRRVLLVLVLVGIIAAPLTGSLSLWLSAAFGVILTTNLYKTMKERRSTNIAKELDEEFLTIVKPQTHCLDKIVKAYSESNENTSTVVAQAETSLWHTVEFERLLERVTELSAVSTDILTLPAKLRRVFWNLGLLIIEIIRVTPTSEQDIKLRILKSAEQCKKTVSEFQRMKCLLED